MEVNHIDTILRVSEPYLKRMVNKGLLTSADVQKLHHYPTDWKYLSPNDVVKQFSIVYRDVVKKRHQASYLVSSDLTDFISLNTGKIKALWGDCLDVLKNLKNESVHLMVTSPPYYNARDYSHWDNLDMYLADMEKVITESYRVLDNHRAFVFNVGDITGNDNRHTKSVWGSRKIPLGAYFVNIFEKAGFKYIDDFIWDKGEVESQRHKNSETPYPLYQYPINCYEHIYIFYKHRQDDVIYPCPVCGCLKVNGNAHSGVGIQSWECKNLDCFERSESNRGKRFSLRSIVMDDLQDNIVPKELIKKWRRDIVEISPVKKINSKGENVLGHTAPFPFDIPEYAIRTLSGKGEIVMDSFAGSFTSPIEAQKWERIGVGVEKNKDEFRDSIIINVEKRNMNLEELNVKCP